MTRAVKLTMREPKAQSFNEAQRWVGDPRIKHALVAAHDAAPDDKEETMSTAWIRTTEDETRWQDDTGERMCWPSIVQYTDGEAIADTPDGLPEPTAGYRYVVHDLEAKELLDATGLLYDGRHRGGWVNFRGARNAPGA